MRQPAQALHADLHQLTDLHGHQCQVLPTHSSVLKKGLCLLETNGSQPGAILFNKGHRPVLSLGFTTEEATLEASMDRSWGFCSESYSAQHSPSLHNKNHPSLNIKRCQDTETILYQQGKK